MSVAFALITTDPNLVQCELARLGGQVCLDSERANAVGLGTHVQEEVLLRRWARVSPLQVETLASQPGAETLLFHAGQLAADRSPEDDTQPFRMRGWLLAHQGVLEGGAELRAALLAGLPDFLRRMVRGESDGELALALFLGRLRELGRMEDPRLQALLAGRELAATAQGLAQASASSGAPRLSTLNLIASNGRVLAATRLGALPLYFKRLEGTERCARCHLDARTPETHPLLEAHRRRGSLALATHLGPQATGWTELGQGQTLAVDAALHISGPA